MHYMIVAADICQDDIMPIKCLMECLKSEKYFVPGIIQ